MRKNRWICFGAAAMVCVIGGSHVFANASETVDVESAMAGVAVDLNNYYASSLNPEDELRDFLNSEVIVGDPEAQSEEEPEEEEQSQTEQSEEETSAGNPEEQTAEETTEEQAAEEQTAETPAETETEPETQAEKVSPYANVAVSHVSSGSYVNVRTEPNTSSEILGKLYNDCAATILDTVAGEDGDWYEIKSGSVQGYIKAEYFITGDAAEARAIEIGKLEGYVNTNGLRLRAEPNLDSDILTLLWSGETYSVLEDCGEFVKVQVDDDLVGYVYGEMIDVSVKFDTAISLAEEKAKQEEEARKKAEAAAAAAKLEEARRAAAAEAAAAEAAAQENGGSSEEEAPVSNTSVTSASRDALVSYAKQWVGVTPYVYGGTSLTNGSDCSYFVQACYANALGVSLPRDSRSQASGCTEISESDLQPGDLVFYSSGGTISHVAIYIGGGQIVHASNASVGTVISNMKYREPCMYGRYID